MILALLPDNEPMVLSPTDFHFGLRLKIHKPMAECHRLTEEMVDELHGLWHFDPWWMLNEPRFQDKEWAH